MNVSFFKRAIKAKGMTQEQFAEAVGISYAALKKYFSGKTSPSIEIFQKMCDVFGCSVDYALTGNGSLPYLFDREKSDIYGLLKDLGYNVVCDPADEDRIRIETLGVSAETRIPELTQKVKEFIQFEVYRLAKEQEV